MIPQIIKYFRFDSYEDEEGNIFYAPPNFKGREEYYEGYNLSPFSIEYNIKRDVDFEPDSFTITIESYFFQNPLNESHYSKLKLTDTKNAFEPTTNHVIVIGPSPKQSDANAVNMEFDSYCYEDKYPEISSPVFGLIKSCTKSGSDKMIITCVSFLKVLNDFQLGTDYKLNNWNSDTNDMQIYYEYRENEEESSDPYFAPKDITRRSTSGRYMITPAVESHDKDERYPLFPTFNVGTATANMKYGYEAPKIAHRLLQEVGWCRDGYKTECLESIATAPVSVVSPYVSTGFINPYQQFNINAYGTGKDPDFYYNKNIMTSTQVVTTNLKFNFSAFESDGLRYDYNIVNDYAYQTYYASYDPSRQSILYNLKNLADSDSLFLTVTCCPRFVKAGININDTKMVWDYKRVYGNTTNLKRWGITAGFRPKLLLRRNIAQSLGELPDEYEIAVETISYGTFNSDPTLPNRNPVLAKSISWETDQSDVINKVAIKYGQGSNDLTKYVELPSYQMSWI